MVVNIYDNNIYMIRFMFFRLFLGIGTLVFNPKIVKNNTVGIWKITLFYKKFKGLEKCVDVQNIIPISTNMW